MMNVYVSLVVGLLTLVNSQELPTRWKVQEYPNPIYQVEVCGRSPDTLTSWICDPNNVIKEQDVEEISNMLDNIYENTRCNCEKCIRDKNGYVVMVAIMPTMYRLVNKSNDVADVFMDARIYAYYLSLYWGTFVDCQQLVLILYSRDDGVTYTLTQKDSGSKLTDSLITEITLEKLQYLNQGTKEGIGRGLKEMISQYHMVLTGQRQ